MFGKSNNVDQLKPLLEKNFKGSKDATFQNLDNGNYQLEMIYINSVIDTSKIHDMFVKPFFEVEKKEQYTKYLQSLGDYKEYKNERETIKDILHGSVVFLIDQTVHLIGLNHQENNSVLDANVETTIMGPQKGLSENINVNLNLIRHRYHVPSLTVENNYLVGDKSNIEVVLLYDSEQVDTKVLKKVKEQLNKVDRSIVQSVGELHRALTSRKRRLFPTLMVTERPDRIAYNLSLGKVIVMMEGTPFVLITPAVFYDFMTSMEDFYQPYFVGKFLVLLRYIGLLISLFLPSFYVGIISYNPEILRIQLAFSIAGSRIPVPFPSYLEVIFMLIMMEMLVEASIRLPKTIGPTATTVGGLILGQATTEAGLVSNIMIIIVASVAISNFIIPINEMSFSMRVVKYFLLLFTTLFGLIGLVISTIGLIFYLVNLESHGYPYLKLFFSESKRPSKVS